MPLRVASVPFRPTRVGQTMPGEQAMPGEYFEAMNFGRVGRKALRLQRTFIVFLDDGSAFHLEDCPKGWEVKIIANPFEPKPSPSLVHPTQMGTFQGGVLRHAPAHKAEQIGNILLMTPDRRVLDLTWGVLWCRQPEDEYRVELLPDGALLEVFNNGQHGDARLPAGERHDAQRE